MTAIDPMYGLLQPKSLGLELTKTRTEESIHEKCRSGLHRQYTGSIIQSASSWSVTAELKDPITGGVIPLPSPANNGFLDHAAAALGCAAGKKDLISIVLVVYNNRALKVPDETHVLSTLVGTGAAMEVEKWAKYIDYDNYSYSRSSTFPGCISSLLIDEIAGTATPFKGTLINCAFGNRALDDNDVCSDTGIDFTGATGVHVFAQRANDTRAVIAFTHDNVTFNVDQVGENSNCGILAALLPLAN